VSDIGACNPRAEEREKGEIQYTSSVPQQHV